MTLSSGVDMSVGDTGLGMCMKTPSTLTQLLTLQAYNSIKVFPYQNNGWDIYLSKLTYDLTTGVYNFTAVSKDLNTNG